MLECNEGKLHKYVLMQSVVFVLVRKLIRPLQIYVEHWSSGLGMCWYLFMNVFWCSQCGDSCVPRFCPNNYLVMVELGITLMEHTVLPGFHFCGVCAWLGREDRKEDYVEAANLFKVRLCWQVLASRQCLTQ